MYICNFSLPYPTPQDMYFWYRKVLACLTSFSSLFIPLMQKVRFPSQDLRTGLDCLSFLYRDLCCSIVSWSCQSLSKWWRLWLLYLKHLSLPPTLSNLCILFSPLSTRHVWHIFILFLNKPEYQLYEIRFLNQFSPPVSPAPCLVYSTDCNEMNWKANKGRTRSELAHQ